MVFTTIDGISDWKFRSNNDLFGVVVDGVDAPLVVIIIIIPCRHAHGSSSETCSCQLTGALNCFDSDLYGGLVLLWLIL